MMLISILYAINDNLYFILNNDVGLKIKMR